MPLVNAISDHDESVLIEYKDFNVDINLRFWLL